MSILFVRQCGRWSKSNGYDRNVQSSLRQCQIEFAEQRLLFGWSKDGVSDQVLGRVNCPLRSNFGRYCLVLRSWLRNGAERA